MTDRCYFFGCWNVPGHELRPRRYQDKSTDAERRGVEYYSANSHLDGSLAPKRFRGRVTCVHFGADDRERLDIHYAEELPQGQFLRHELPNGFTAIQWWDRNQGDTRGACNSTILLEGKRTTEEVLVAGKLHFPHVFERLEKAGVALFEVFL